MPKFESKRNRPDAKPATRMPKILRRATGGSGSQSLSNKLLPKTQCTATAKGRLKRYWISRMIADGHQGIPQPDDPDFRYSEIVEIARGLGYETSVKTLDASVRAQCRCTKPAVPGNTVCKDHGGSTPKAIQAARDKLVELLDPSLARATKIITKGKHDPSAVALIKDVFDRVGLKKPDDSKQQHDLVWSDELIGKIADILTEDEIETFLRIYRKIQANMPEPDQETELIAATGTDGTMGMRVVNVGPKKMAELIKTGGGK